MHDADIPIIAYEVILTLFPIFTTMDSETTDILEHVFLCTKDFVWQRFPGWVVGPKRMCLFLIVVVRYLSKNFYWQCMKLPFSSFLIIVLSVVLKFCQSDG